MQKCKAVYGANKYIWGIKPIKQLKMKKIIIILMPCIVLFSCGSNSFKSETQIFADSLSVLLNSNNDKLSLQFYDSLRTIHTRNYIEYAIEDSVVIDKMKKLLINRIQNENEKDSLLVNSLNAKILSSTRKVYNDFDEVYWIYGKLAYNGTNEVYCYLGQKKDKVWIRFQIEYYGEDWVFMDEVDFFADGKTYNLTIDDRKTKVISGGDVREWFDIVPDIHLINFLSEASKSKEFKYRLVGRENSFTRKVTANEKASLSQIIDSYKLFKEIDSLKNEISKRKYKIFLEAF